jgi:hypothetical protein
MALRARKTSTYLERGLWKEALAAGDDCPLSTRVAAYTFLGLFDQAESIFKAANQDKLPQDQRIMTRFFLATAAIRRSEFKRAEQWQALNRKEKKPSSLGRFYQEQGDLFRDFYTGHLPAALARSATVLPLARKAKDSFALILALDALGHVQARMGRLQAGLALLEEAKTVAQKVGNKNFSETIGLSQLLYRAEFLTDTESFHQLESLWKAGGPENSFAPVSLGLELARQYTLRGRYISAREVLEKVAPLLYRSMNRRQEIVLNLRFAELSFRQGEDFLCRHFVEFARRLLSKEPDQSLSLPLFGLERKIGVPLDLKSWAEINSLHGSARDNNLRFRLGLTSEQNAEDSFHRMLVESDGDSDVLLRQRVLGLAADREELPRGKSCLLLTPKGILVSSKEGMDFVSLKLSSLQWRFLLCFSQQSNWTKSALVRSVWGYHYHPLRHDPLLYGLVHTMRRLLGPTAGRWIVATEQGYDFNGIIIVAAKARSFLNKSGEADKTLPIGKKEEQLPSVLENSSVSIELNPRQWLILKRLQEKRFMGTADCKEDFGVSEVTAFRDLHGLCRLGLVSKMGRARATRYYLVKNMGRPQ